MDVVDGDPPVAACDADSGEVVGEPIRWLDGAVVLGRGSREHETTWKRFLGYARSKARMPLDVVFLQLAGELNFFAALASVLEVVEA